MHRHFKMFMWIAAASLVIPGVAIVSASAGQSRARPRATTAAIATPSATRAVDMFLKIDGIEGEATDAGHGEWIDVLSVSWGTANSSSRQTSPVGSGPGTLTLVRSVDRASARLSEACTSGRSLGRVVLHARSRQGGLDEYLMDDVSIRSCSQGSAGDRPTENVTLNFAKIELRPEGNPDRPIVTGR
jgi:type VI secretion system secreted protein Hcp